MNRNAFLSDPLTGNYYYVLMRPEGTLVNLSYNGDPIIDIISSDEGISYSATGQTVIYCFKSAMDAEGMRSELIRLKPEHSDELEELEISWLTKKDFYSGDFGLDYYPYY